MIRNIGRALSSIYEEKYNGSFIGKIEFYKRNDNDSQYKVLLIRERKEFTIVGVQNKSGIVMKLFIIKESFNSRISSKITLNSDFIIEFSLEDVLIFGKNTGDKNNIHSGDRAIVQGLLILEKLNEWEKNVEVITIKFIKPVYVDEKINISIIKNEVIGHIENKIKFIANIIRKEENNENKRFN